MSRVLLLDTAFSSLPIYRFLLGRGHDVFVMGNRANDALALKAGSNWIDQDYSQVTEVRQIISDLSIDFVLPGCTDLSIEVCQQVAPNHHCFDHPENYRFLGEKQKFREMCALLLLSSPQRQQKEDFPLHGRFICKPVDAFSGRGVSVVEGNDIDALTIAYEQASAVSPTGRALIETFVDGQLYSYSAFIEQQKVIDSFVVLEGSSANPYAVDTSYVDREFDEVTLAMLKESVETIAAHLKLVDGLVHLQFILQDKTPYLIEITRRCPGDLYSKLIEYSTGYDYAGKFASYFLKEPYSTQRTESQPIVRHTVSSMELCRYDGLNFIEPTKIKAFFPLLSLGEEVQPRQKTRVGIIFTQQSDIKKSYDQYISRLKYNLSVDFE
ncbi:ATP-grasp domain-containing protein [Vibrio cidicii]|nr:ATP-grasp domain-containing protein [Vibrio cidicii]